MSRRLVRKAIGCLADNGRARDAGMTTAEYAVGTLAAVAFAAVLLAVVKSGAVQSALMAIITAALNVVR